MSQFQRKCGNIAFANLNRDNICQEFEDCFQSYFNFLCVFDKKSENALLILFIVFAVILIVFIIYLILMANDKILQISSIEKS